MVLASTVVLLGLATWVACSTFVASNLVPPLPSNPASTVLMTRDAFPKSMERNAPGIQNPIFITAAEADLADERVVIGVVVSGEARAYLRDAFDGPTRHVVNDLFGSTPVTITHCDRRCSTRVLTQLLETQKPLNIRVGGWSYDDAMLILIVNERKYTQTAADLPLADVPFSEVTWGEWRQEHPESLVYLGPSMDS